MGGDWTWRDGGPAHYGLESGEIRFPDDVEDVGYYFCELRASVAAEISVGSNPTNSSF